MKKEDFDSKDQGLVDKLAFPINNFMQQVVNVFKNGIDFNNLNMQSFTLTVSVDSGGIPISTVQFNNALSTKALGMICINAVNKSSTIRFPSAHPGLTWNQNNNVLKVTNISGLPIPSGQTNSDVYEITILVINQNIPTT